jgi:predicted membrane-bound mannosyltransferase
MLKGGSPVLASSSATFIIIIISFYAPVFGVK